MHMQALDSLKLLGAQPIKAKDTAAQVSFILASKNQEIRSSKMTLGFSCLLRHLSLQYNQDFSTTSRKPSSFPSLALNCVIIILK